MSVTLPPPTAPPVPAPPRAGTSRSLRGFLIIGGLAVWAVLGGWLFNACRDDQPAASTEPVAVVNHEADDALLAAVQDSFVEHDFGRIGFFLDRSATLLSGDVSRQDRADAVRMLDQAGDIYSAVNDDVVATGLATPLAVQTSEAMAFCAEAMHGASDVVATGVGWDASIEDVGGCQTAQTDLLTELTGGG